MNRRFCLLWSARRCLPAVAAEAVGLASPHGRVQFRFQSGTEARLQYSVALRERTVVENSEIGTVVDGADLSRGVEFGPQTGIASTKPIAGITAAPQPWTTARAPEWLSRTLVHEPSTWPRWPRLCTRPVLPRTGVVHIHICPRRRRATAVRTEHQPSRRGHFLYIDMRSGGGFVGRFSP